jgi:hypothetical protein
MNDIRRASRACATGCAADRGRPLPTGSIACVSIARAVIRSRLDMITAVASARARET